MSALSSEQVLSRIKKPKNKTYIDLAVLQTERLFLHAEPILEKYNLPFTAFNNFTKWWQSLVSEDKYNRIDELLNCPFETVDIVKDIFDDLKKFIDAQDRFIDFKFINRDFTNDYREFLLSQNDEDFWKSKIIHELKTGICSYLVIDNPVIQTTERPEPYQFFVSPSMLIDVDINKFSNKVEYIVFKQSEFYWDAEMSTTNTNANLRLLGDNSLTQKVIAIDDNFWRVYVRPDVEAKNTKWRKDPRTSELEWVLLSENPHKLGYCPAIDFWKDYIKGSNGINKCGPITLQLKKLDYYQFFSACIDYMNLYGPFPVENSYDDEVNEFDDKTKEINTGNYWASPNTSSVSNFAQTQDPRTSGRKGLGPGSGKKWGVPERQGDFDPMQGEPVKFTGMPVENWEAANRLLERKEMYIKKKCTGIDSEYMNEINKNAEMIASSYRKQDSIISWIQRNMERVHKFVTDTKCRLRYGNDYYLGCTIDYGSDYILKDATTLSNEFGDSVEKGMPQAYSFEIATSAIETRFSNNPKKIAKLSILRDLEPYPNISLENIKLLEINTSDVENFKIKINFSSFVSRFEREAGCDIVDFGTLIPYPEKINIINSKFKEYAAGIKWAESESGGKPGNTADSESE
jgi:hypothetical protein